MIEACGLVGKRNEGRSVDAKGGKPCNCTDFGGLEL